MLKGVKIQHQSHRLDSCRGGSKCVREKQTTEVWATPWWENVLKEMQMLGAAGILFLGGKCSLQSQTFQDNKIKEEFLCFYFLLYLTLPGIQVYLQPLPLLVPLKLQLTLITLMDCLISSSFFVLSLIKCFSSDLFFPRLFCVSKIKTWGGNWNLLPFKVLHTGREAFVSCFQVFFLYMQMWVPSIIPSIQILSLTQQFALK